MCNGIVVNYGACGRPTRRGTPATGTDKKRGIRKSLALTEWISDNHRPTTITAAVALRELLRKIGVTVPRIAPIQTFEPRSITIISARYRYSSTCES